MELNQNSLVYGPMSQIIKLRIRKSFGNLIIKLFFEVFRIKAFCKEFSKQPKKRILNKFDFFRYYCKLPTSSDLLPVHRNKFGRRI